MHTLKALLILTMLHAGLPHHATLAQKPAVENSVFWEVTGKDLTTPSYLYGTLHLMGSRYVDSLTNVMHKFDSSKTFAGELLFDSTMITQMMTAASLKDTTLDKLLGEEWYYYTAVWLRELSGYDLAFFNTMNPITVQILLTTLLQQQYYPLDPALDTPMDLYFLKLAKGDGKKLTALETFEDQLYALYGQFSYERQATLLIQFVREKDRSKTELINMNRLYRDGNLNKLEELMAGQAFLQAEAESMLDNRNKKWVTQLRILMKEQSTFAAVGALHLAGKNGIITLLRKQGYTVKPIPLK